MTHQLRSLRSLHSLPSMMEAVRVTKAGKVRGRIWEISLESLESAQNKGGGY